MNIHVIGSAGYLGTRLVRALRGDGWDVTEWDCGAAYGNVTEDEWAFTDVLDENEPFGNDNDGAPVVWLASVHREPVGFADFDRASRDAWVDVMRRLIVEAPLQWLAAGHPLVYASSMLVVSRDDPTMYGAAKQAAERELVGQRARVLRFGTLWGDLARSPARLETAINGALLGHELPETYKSYTTHISTAVSALALAALNPETGTVENVTDGGPKTGPEINAILETSPQERDSWGFTFARESAAARDAGISRDGYIPPIERLARYYGLPLEPNSGVEGAEAELGPGDGDGDPVK